MTKAYRSGLPEMFPMLVVLRESELAERLAILLAPNSRYPNGSSFAVTVDCEEGNRALWMSRASHERLKEAGL